MDLGLFVGGGGSGRGLQVAEHLAASGTGSWGLGEAEDLSPAACSPSPPQGLASSGLAPGHLPSARHWWLLQVSMETRGSGPPGETDWQGTGMSSLVQPPEGTQAGTQSKRGQQGLEVEQRKGGGQMGGGSGFVEGQVRPCRWISFFEFLSCAPRKGWPRLCSEPDLEPARHCPHGQRQASGVRGLGSGSATSFSC